MNAKADKLVLSRLSHVEIGSSSIGSEPKSIVAVRLCVGCYFSKTGGCLGIWTNVRLDFYLYGGGWAVGWAGVDWAR